MAPATSGREREGDHLVFTQTVLSAMVHSEYGSGNVQVLGFWYCLTLGQYPELHNAGVIELYVVRVLGGKFFFALLQLSITISKCITWGQCYKTFYGRKLRLFIISYSVFPGNHFQPSLMFACKAGAYSSEVPFRCSTHG
jgi:hypothetical protein